MCMHYVFACLYVHHMHACALRGQRSVESPGVGVIGYCELPYVGAGNQIQGFCKSKCPEPLSYLSIHNKLIFEKKCYRTKSPTVSSWRSKEGK